MTLGKDRPRKNTRPPMRRSTFFIIIGVVIAVFVFVIVTLIVSGQSFF